MRLKWRWDSGVGSANVAGYALLVDASGRDDCRWAVTDSRVQNVASGIIPTPVKRTPEDCRAIIIEAQQSAESAVARLLGEDEGLRALVPELRDWVDASWTGLARFVTAHAERDALRARVAELGQAQRWIPVRERMPEDGAAVLAYGHRRGDARHRVVERWGSDWVCIASGAVVADHVTHWRHLPKEPEG